MVPLKGQQVVLSKDVRAADVSSSCSGRLSPSRVSVTGWPEKRSSMHLLKSTKEDVGKDF